MTNRSGLKTKYPEIEKFPIIFEMPLLWGDMDSAKHVNNLVYLKWSETARIQLFEKLMDTTFEGKEGPILGWQDCKYIFPITYPDTAVITCGVTEIKEDRFILTSKIYSINFKRIVAISKQSIIPYNYLKLKKINLSDSWRDKLMQLLVDE